MKKSILLIMLTGTSLVSPQNNTTQICNFTGPSDLAVQCLSFFQVTAESTKAARCRNSGIIRVNITFNRDIGFTSDIAVPVTVNGPNGFSSSTPGIIPGQIQFKKGDSIPFEIPVPSGGSYTVTTNINAAGPCTFTCTNILVKQISCFPLIYCCAR